MFAEVSVFYLWPSQAELEIFMGWGWFGVWNRVPGLGAGGEGWERGIGACGTGFRCKQREGGAVRHGL